MSSKIVSTRSTSYAYPSIGTNFIQVRLLEDFNLAIVGVDLRIYYLGKRYDIVELPAKNAMHLISKNLAAFCSN